MRAIVLLGACTPSASTRDPWRRSCDRQVSNMAASCSSERADARLAVNGACPSFDATGERGTGLTEGASGVTCPDGRGFSERSAAAACLAAATEAERDQARASTLMERRERRANDVCQ